MTMTAPTPAHCPHPAALTYAQRRALRIACTGIASRDVGKQVTARTITTLAGAGLIHQRTSRKGRSVWRATDVGRGVVASSGLVPTFLHRMSQYGYTHDLALALRHEPEVML